MLNSQLAIGNSKVFGKGGKEEMVIVQVRCTFFYVLIKQEKQHTKGCRKFAYYLMEFAELRLMLKDSILNGDFT